MKEATLEERIKAVMLFDGWVKNETHDFKIYYTHPIRKGTFLHQSIEHGYTHSYDWLMPVWVKFRDMISFLDKVHRNEYNHYYVLVSHCITEESITETFNALSEAIMCHNGLTTDKK